MTARDVIAQALALSEAATDGEWVRKDEYRRPGGKAVRIQLAPNYYAAAHCGTEANAEFVEAARTLLPAFAKALGDVLDEMERPIHLDDTDDGCVPVRRLRAITAALSEVTP